MMRQPRVRAAVALFLAVLLPLTYSAAWAVPAVRKGAVVIFDVQDATGLFRPSTATAEIGHGLEAEGLQPLCYGDLPLIDKYQANPRTKVKEPKPEALAEATRPTEAERVLLLTLTSYTYDGRSGKAVLEARVRGMIRKPDEETYEPIAGTQLTGEVPGGPRYKASELVAQRAALERLGREAAAWLLKGTPSQGRPYHPRPKKPSLLQKYMMPGLVLLIVTAYYFKTKNRRTSGVISSRLPAPIPLTATPAGPGATSLTWQAPTVPNDLALRAYEIEVSLDGGGYQFAGQVDQVQGTTTVSYGVGPGIAQTADFRIRAVARDANDNEFVSIYAYFPTVVGIF
jgi:hypothetical protein